LCFIHLLIFSFSAEVTQRGISLISWHSSSAVTVTASKFELVDCKNSFHQLALNIWIFSILTWMMRLCSIHSKRKIWESSIAAWLIFLQWWKWRKELRKTNGLITR
jgi:hypothetical protein